jgi:glycosyltransferase involved in cell wall biosynthesis
MAYRILVVTSSFPAAPGSVASAFLGDWATSLAARGHSLTVLAPEDPQHPSSQAANSRIEIAAVPYLPYSRFQTLTYGAGMYDNVLGNPARIAQLPCLLMSLFQSALRLARRADLIHAHWLFPAGLIGAMVKRGTGIPLVVTIHSTDYHLLRALPGGRALARHILRYADRVHFISAYHQRLVGEWLGEPERVRQMSYVAPMGVPDGLSSAPVWPLRGTPRIGFLGRLVPIKGADRLLRSCAAVGATKVTIGGAGPERAKLRRLGDQLKLDVVFAGAVSGADKLALIDGADILCFPSRTYSWGRCDGLPVSLMEALIRGRVAVASNAGSIPEIIAHGENGYLFEACSDAALTSTLAGILERWPQSAGVAAAARQVGTRLTASTLAHRHDEAYRAVLAPDVVSRESLA